MKKIRFIINPKAGTLGLGQQEIEFLVRNELNKMLFQAEFCYTEFRGHAGQLALEAVAQGLEYVVAVGGDGTVNEVATSLAGTNTALGIVPLGSGNGLARQLQLPLEPAKAIKFLNNAPVISIDYGTINQIPFFCVAGVGFDAHVAGIFDKSLSRGLKTYIRLVIREYFKYKPKYFKIINDTGQPIFEGLALLVAIANAAQYGNNTFIAPKAHLRDGILDLVIVRPFAWHKLLSVGWNLYRRKLDASKYIDTHRLKNFQLILEQQDIAHIDGETLELPADNQIQVVARTLKVMTGIFL